MTFKKCPRFLEAKALTTNANPPKKVPDYFRYRNSIFEKLWQK